jgi:hypothetical protein|tara:strand:+ start:393 stop:914 length:522 start_codon:yes stop_codon:yes gene_type:complete
MASPTDLVPERYEVIKLKNGTEVVGMTRDCGDKIEITLPMICQLSLVPGTPRTNAVFFPYSPLSSDEKVNIPKFEIVHRNIMNEQFVPYYDNASAKWMEMIENKSIPLANAEDLKVQEVMRRHFDRLLTHEKDNFLEPPDAEFIEEILEDMADQSDYEEFKYARPPKDKKKFH